MGLPGSGKTTLAKLLAPMFNAVWLNADEVRKEADDWDFSVEGRDRQANRMKTLAQEAAANNRVVVADFICPTERTRQHFDAGYTIWMDTIKVGKFEDTNELFEPLQEDEYTYIVDTWFDNKDEAFNKIINWYYQKQFVIFQK